MSQPTDKKNAPETAINNAPHAPLAVQPSGGIENQYPNPTTNKPEISEYKSDWLESLSRYEKGLILFVVIAGIYWIAFYSKWINEHQTEFFVGCLLSLSLLIVATCQAYIYKRQAHAMREGLEKTEKLLGQNEQMIKAVKAQGQHAKTQADLMDKQLTAMRQASEQADKHFGIAERAYVMIENVAFPTEFKEGNANLASVVVLNGGRTPAMDVSITAHSELINGAFGDIEAETIHTRHRAKGPALLVPDKPTPIITKPFINFSGQDFRDWYDNKKALFIQIAVNYRDLQDVERVTYFWYQLERHRMVFDVRFSKIGTYAKPILDPDKLWRKMEGPDWGKPIENDPNKQ